MNYPNHARNSWIMIFLSMILLIIILALRHWYMVTFL